MSMHSGKTRLKTVKLTIRIEPSLKQQAETILEELGIPVSVGIEILYRQIIIQEHLPFSINEQPSADKTARVIVRLQPDIKAKAETILHEKEISASKIIECFYKEIISSNGFPLPLYIDKKETVSVKESYSGIFNKNRIPQISNHADSFADIDDPLKNYKREQDWTITSRVDGDDDYYKT